MIGIKRACFKKKNIFETSENVANRKKKRKKEKESKKKTKRLSRLIMT